MKSFTVASPDSKTRISTFLYDVSTKNERKEKYGAEST